MSSIAANGGMARSTGSGLALRVLSAAALIPLVLALLWVGGWPFVGLVALVAVLMGVEWHQLTLGDLDREAMGTVVFMAGAVLLFPMTPVWAGPLVLAIGAAAALLKTDAAQRTWRLLPFVWLGLPALEIPVSGRPRLCRDLQPRDGQNRRYPWSRSLKGYLIPQVFSPSIAKRRNPQP